MKMLIPTEEAKRNTEPSATVVKQVSPKSVVLFVGTAFPRQDEDLPGYQQRYVPDLNDTGGVIAGIRAAQQIPAVIVYRFNIGYEDAFAQWKQYFDRHPSHRNIPFFVYADQVSDSLRTFVKKYPFVDEIITRNCLNHLPEKIAFVNKHKRMQRALMVDERPRQKQHSAAVSLINSFLKRSFDILVAGTALTLLLPVLLIVAFAIKCESRGPVFYISPRAGKNYRIFKFYKFRSMVVDADKQLDKLKHLNQYDITEDKADGPKFYKVSNDPRVTRFGMFLRNSSLDELPQLINVLKGDMSLVGNRPLPLYEASTLTTDEWVQRFLGPAGITGLWQISKRGKKDMSAQERIELDINYTQKCSFGYDMWIIASTPKALIQKDNV